MIENKEKRSIIIDTVTWTILIFCPVFATVLSLGYWVLGCEPHDCW